VRERLKCWRRSTEAALAGIYTHRLHAALHATVLRFGVPKEYLLEVITGVESDLEPVAFQSFEELYPYCYRVASVVGLACLPIWGCFSPSALRPAESAGIAFQLTNILRDLAEDAARDRYYLPAADWQRFECPPETWPACGENFREMMAEQVSRARRFYEESDALLPYLPRPGLAMFLTMRSTYRSLLEEIATRNYDVYSRRVRVPRWRKAQILAAAWPIKWGWRG
jgi:phytoene synthase